MKDPLNQPSFETTRWSVVVSAGQEDSKLARDAMEQLCRRYWFPLFAFIRRRGYGESDAEDLVQAFFVRVVEKDVFAAADQDRGRFRTFLLTSLENFLANEYAKSTALRRGGGNKLLSLELRNADGKRPHRIADGGRPEDEYHRQWAIAALSAALETVETEYERDGNAALFSELRPYLSTDGERKPYALVAKSLGISPTNVKVAVHRLRKRYRRQLESEIASTVESPEQIEDEIRQLFQALGG
ncbi:sigma-70 family RNA polymerase sigma factor [Stieleria sp. ICT_E10.1]|uniref:RNA polymerase sigma factor n=1 Tax=Stieleria sedimenti TaxID=2976331 RepID=UPI00217FE938|nr:sigma-70 family RNA polymerase sigma factor [Stieleria sedimenti]MCS7466623.1 sigma-70 family RNA polymerase sigma factor [Stieleria sedimenti]